VPGQEWYRLTTDEILVSLATDLDRGLTNDAAYTRLAEYGPNTITPQKGAGLFKRALTQFNQPLVIILIAAGAVTAGLREWVDAGVIFGVVIINAIIGYLQEAKAVKAIDALSRSMTAEATVLRDGHRVRVLANISSLAEAAGAVDAGAEGVGVLRTEFLFLGRTAAPTEQEQYAAYREIAASLGGRPLVVRTLDAGGDKDLPYMDIGEEANPFLGWRGVRLTLGRPEICKTQIRAILRAGAGSPEDIQLPMVACVDELRAFKELIAAATAELEAEGILFGRRARAGVMIEVPAAAVLAAELAREADFFSIGTNDLCQYVMAADRTSVRVASLADPFQPAVGGGGGGGGGGGEGRGGGGGGGGGAPRGAGGGARPPAGGPTPLLLGLGVEEFSVSAHLIPEVKASIARWTMPEARRRAEAALAADTAAAVRRILGDPPRNT
jgi:phosphocarrier protein FPr